MVQRRKNCFNEDFNEGFNEGIDGDDRYEDSNNEDFNEDLDAENLECTGDCKTCPVYFQCIYADE